MGSALGFVTKPTRVIQPGRFPERAIETVTVPPSPRSEGSAIPQNEPGGLVPILNLFLLSVTRASSTLQDEED